MNQEHIHNPWRESLVNCTTGDNYLRSSEYYQLIEELDRLYALEAISGSHAPEPVRCLRSVWDVTQAEQDAMREDQWAAWKAELRAAKKWSLLASELLTAVEEMKNDAQDVYNLPETRQDIFDAIEYCASWMTVYIKKRAPTAQAQQSPEDVIAFKFQAPNGAYWYIKADDLRTINYWKEKRRLIPLTDKQASMIAARTPGKTEE